jgi:hypothetical protein
MEILQLRAKSKTKVAVALAAGVTLLVAGLVQRSRPVGADPAFPVSYVGVGSDTLQDVFNSYAGAEPAPPATNAKLTTRLTSSAATGTKGVSSWDAAPGSNCIATKLGGGAYDRPNGSGDGIAALSNANNTPQPTNWLGKGNCAPPATGSNVQGQIDFARSSRGPTVTTNNALTYIPFSRDAVSYAYFDHGTGNASHLTTTDLFNLYNSGPQHLADANNDLVIPCITQAGSGTTKFFLQAIGNVPAATANANSALPAPGGCGTANPSTLEENGGNTFFGLTTGSAVGTDYVVDFSVGSWISQANGVAVDRSNTARGGGVDLGNIDSIGTAKPYDGVAPNENPDLPFYASTTYGRNIYVVVPTGKIGTFGDSGLKSLFVGGGAAICAAGAQATANSFGFASFTGVLAGLGTCGATTLTGSLFS